VTTGSNQSCYAAFSPRPLASITKSSFLSKQQSCIWKRLRLTEELWQLRLFLFPVRPRSCKTYADAKLKLFCFYTSKIGEAA
jgi:hypothetical protein